MCTVCKWKDEGQQDKEAVVQSLYVCVWGGRGGGGGGGEGGTSEGERMRSGVDDTYGWGGGGGGMWEDLPIIGLCLQQHIIWSHDFQLQNNQAFTPSDHGFEDIKKNIY